MERQSAEWENIFANQVPDQGLISRIAKELLQLKTKKTNKGTGLRETELRETQGAGATCFLFQKLFYTA